ncbi:hypothetical protein HD593_000698 [Nonomuraea rubra]|uniref:Uncharacterized protein n=1 Tax=Nonomuraea rubra TaxID=46180 RepID=A0A7X0NLZ9_9ACTN|nr:hypothetical protein [Nonomuraea rubra]
MMRFHVLGSFEVRTGDGAVDVHVNQAGFLCGMGYGVYVRRGMGYGVYIRRGVRAGLAPAPSDPRLWCPRGRLLGRLLGRLPGRLLAEDNGIPAAKAALPAAVAADSRPAEVSRNASADQDGDLDAPVQFFDVHADVAAIAGGRRPGRGRPVPRSSARGAGGGQGARDRRVTCSGRR